MWLFLLACASTEDSAEPVRCAEPQPVDIEGAVAGTRADSTTYVVPWSGEERTIPVHVWYPTADASGTTARWLDTFPDPNSWVDAGLAPGCMSPVVVYSHGSQGWAGNGAPLLRQFVAAGWIAVAPDHVDNTLTDNVDPKPETYPLVRTEDVRATLDWIQSLPADDPLHDRVDTSRVFMFGHSYGGQTAWLLGGPTFDADAIAARCAASAVGCTTEEQAAYADRAVDDRIVAVAPLAGTAGTDLVGSAGWDTLDRPTLFMTGSADSDGSDAYAKVATKAVTWVELTGGCHESFTATEVPCDLDKTRGLTAVATWLTAFAASHVLGDDASASILDGTESVDELAVRRGGP